MRRVFLFTLFRTLLPIAKSYPQFLQQLPHSFDKTTGVACHPLQRKGHLSARRSAVTKREQYIARPRPDRKPAFFTACIAEPLSVIPLESQLLQAPSLNLHGINNFQKNREGVGAASANCENGVIRKRTAKM